MVEYESEIATWVKALDMLQQENIQMKTLLADTVKFIGDGTTLEEMESYLNRFISKDAAFALMRYDIAEHVKNVRKNGSQVRDLARKQLELNRDMIKMEGEFGKLKHDFNLYLNALAV